MKMTKTVKAASKKTKTVVAPVKEFVAGQLAFYDEWDDGRGNSTTTTSVVLVRSIEFCGPSVPIWGLYAVVVQEDGSLAVVNVKTLRHLPEVFNGATI
jgi:hypothetical protein